MWWMVAVGVTALYSGTSFILFCFPNLVHKRKTLCFKPARHISHRGGAGENLENTLTAFSHALECGTDMLEIDCQVTLDGIVVVSHDDNLQRVAGVDLVISETTYENLPAMFSTLPLQFDSSAICESKSLDRRIPTLEEVFQLFPHTPINIDIKREDENLIKNVDELIRKYQRESLTVWGNFQDTICRKCYAQNKSIPLLFSLRKVMLTVLCLYTGLLPFIPLRESCFEIVMPSIFLESPHFQSAGRRQKLLIHIIDFLLMRRCFIAHLQRRGIHVYLWVLNREHEFQRAYKTLGVDGVMTDYPEKLKLFLEKL